MKFTKEKALEAIKAKFIGKSGKTAQKISDRTISDFIDPLYAANVTEETELDDFIETWFSAIDSMNTNLIKEHSDFVKNYKLEPPKPSPKPKDEDGDTGKKGDPEPAPTEIDLGDLMPEFKKQLTEMLNPLLESVEGLKKERAAEARSKELSTKIEELKLGKKEWEVDFNTALQLATLKLGDDASADDVFKSAKEQFEEILSAKGQSYKPADGSGGKGGDASPVKEFVDKFKGEEKAEAERAKDLSNFLGLGEAKRE